MENKKIDSDEDYWKISQTGYDFDTVDWKSPNGDSKLSAVMRNDELNQFDLLRCDGLTEVVENRSAKDFLLFNISPIENEKYAAKLDRNFNPLIINHKRNAESVRYGPEETVKNMVLGLEYSLAGYKGKKEKIALLNAAVKSHDGNAILEVVLYLRDTLKKSVFQREIVAYPDAVNVYLTYLEEDHETDELANMFLLLDKAEEASILKYEAAVMVEHPETKHKWIENCLSTHFQRGATDTFLQQSVEEHRQILEEQIKLEMYNHAHPTNEIQNMLHYEKLTGKKSVIDTSILCSLIFCCLYYYKSDKFQLNFACPEKIKSNYNLSKKQFTWSVLRALAASSRWSDVNDLFISKNWLGNTKIYSCIAYSRILEVMFKAKAPTEVLEKYVLCVENEQEKLVLAQKYRCHSIVIEIFKNNKDRTGLIKYKASLLPHSVDFCNATDVLNNPMIRWKN